jgi:hypothetical protein
MGYYLPMTEAQKTPQNTLHIYTRVSTKSQMEDGVSLESQLEEGIKNKSLWGWNTIDYGTKKVRPVIRKH